MTDHIEAARKVLQGPYEWQTVGDLRILAKPSDIVAALDLAGLLRTGAEKEVMPRLTASVTAMLLTGGLTGHRIGIAPDFDRLTGLHERALRACEEYSLKYPNACLPAECAQVSDVGAESLALKAPKPRWTIRREDDGTKWVVLLDAGSGRASAVFRGEYAEPDARAYAAQKNAEASK
jgi:hypothetical protein